MRIALLGIILGLATPALAHPARPAPRRVGHPHEHRVEVRVRPATPPAVIGMHPVEFQRLLHKVSTRRFEHQRERVLVKAARRNVFSAYQVSRLLNVIPRGHQRLAALEILAPRIADPWNRYEILDAFHFRPERRAAAAILVQPRRYAYLRPAA